MEQALTAEQALEAMRCFLAQFAGREPPESRERFHLLIDWTRVDDVNGGRTFDPAQWHDWTAAVDRAVSGDIEP